MSSSKLDRTQFAKVYSNCRGGSMPSDEVIRTYEAIAEIAYLAYLQGKEDKPFELPFPIINT